MLKKISLLMAAVLFVTAVTAGCSGSEDDSEQVPAELQKLKLSVPLVQDWIFTGNPQFAIHIENPNSVTLDAKAKVVIKTDKQVEVVTITRDVKVPSGESNVDITMPDGVTLDPGFYRASCTVDGRSARAFVFGVNPQAIVSAPDKQADFDEFWNSSVSQLESVQMNATLTELPSRSSSVRKAYLVEMQSIPDGLTGDPVMIRGYYLEPQDGEEHPVIMHFFGYDSQNSKSVVSCPYGGSDATYAEFYLSHRGQYINNRKAEYRDPDDGKGDLTNIYGDWFAYNFGNRDGYYYRGAFLDCVQAIRFIASRSTSDLGNIFAEGSSQGGALSYAAAALSPYPLKAIAPCVAFLGDFPDYFDIVSWPGDVAKANKGSMTDEQMYQFLSYFDTKNLATRIHCAVIACSGLLDETCPPHTNTAPFNNLPGTDKEMYYYPNLRHEIPSNWTAKYMAFFESHTSQ